jgi:hypothetical protein
VVGYLSKKPKLSFVDDSGKLYRQRRRATQAKVLETLDRKVEVEGPSESPREPPPPSPKEDQPQSPPMGEQPQPERELCTPDIVDLPIINLQDARRPFKIKVSTIRMAIAGALKRFNEHIRAEFLERHIGFELIFLSLLVLSVASWLVLRVSCGSGIQSCVMSHPEISNFRT